jgi:hypothetical protein
MKRKRLHILLGSLLLILLGGSMTFSTLHSHHHIQWHQSGDFADTGNCITKDVTVCPITGYHLKHDYPEAGDTFVPLPFDGYIYEQQDLHLPHAPHLVDKGRSPPVIA